jgi:hypothetical protein
LIGFKSESKEAVVARPDLEHSIHAQPHANGTIVFGSSLLMIAFSVVLGT